MLVCPTRQQSKIYRKKVLKGLVWGTLDAANGGLLENIYKWKVIEILS